MKIQHYFIFIIVASFSFLSADEFLPTYKMVDLGLFGTDESQAIAVNEKGQVLGTFNEGKYRYFFLWDETNGLAIIEALENRGFEPYKLNNNGQTVGIGSDNKTTKIIYWDANAGFWEIESSKDGVAFVDFNDLGQILGYIGHQIILWDHGKKINLTSLFHEQVPGKWQSLWAVSLNNHGHVVFTANQQDQKYGTKSFIWKDGSFTMILPESGWETSVEVNCMDDDENMIVYINSQRNDIHSGQYFVTQSKHMFIPCQECDIIRNGVPVKRKCLPGKLKKDRHGNLYFSKGVQIKKLLKEEFPYYNISETTEITDQNSSGYVVGTLDTMYPGRHAFLAIPENANINNNENSK